ncbi:MAG: vWA domain-containing protein, partial [Balneolaceae bacterium]
RIKRYLLLFVRLLAIACLALVLARPFLPPGLGGGDNKSAALNVVLLDNSVSMGRIGEKGPLIEQGKQIIAELEASAKDIDRFIFQTTNGEEQFASVIGHSQLLRRLEQAEISNGGNYLEQRLESLVSVLNDSPYENKRLFIISDGQLSQLSGISEIENVPRTITTTLFNLGEVSVQNTVIKSLETSSDMIGVGLPVVLSVNVQNQSEIPISNQFITLEFEGSIVGQYSISLSANAAQTFNFEVIPTTIGTATGKISLEGDEFVSDNTKYFSIQVPESREVLWVTSVDQAIQDFSYTQLVLDASNQSDAQLNYQKIEVGEFESANIEAFEAIIFDGVRSIPEFVFERLQNFVQNGGGIVLFPSEQSDILSYNNFFELYNAGEFVGVVGDYASFNSIASGNQIQIDHPIFTELFDSEENEQIRVTNPEIFYFYRFQPSTSPGGFNVITLNTGDPLIREKRFGDGRIMISAIGNDPGWSNFGVKPLFAPFYYRSLLYIASSAEGGLIEHILGDEFKWSGNISSDNLVLINGDDEIVPEVRNSSLGLELTYSALNWEPGFVSIQNDEEKYQVAVNIDISESEFVNIDDRLLSQSALRVRTINTAEIPDQALTNEIIASGFGREIWQWFMWAGLFFLVLESLISTFYKTETSN